MNRFAVIIVSLIIAGAVLGCQSAKPPVQVAAPPAQAATPPVQTVVPPVQAAAPPDPAVAPPVARLREPGQSFIDTESLGFSPSSETGKTSIDFALVFADAEAVKSWKVAIANDRGEQKSYSGNGEKLPAMISWNGTVASGAFAPQGKYKASLAVDYGSDFSAGGATSTSFILDIDRPTGKIAISPELFSPMETSDKVKIKISPAASLAKIDSWSMDILDPGGNLFKSFSGKWPSDSVAWDGKGIEGDLVVSAEDYPIVLKLRDEFGSVGYVGSNLPIDILVVKDGTGYRIENSRVYFQGFTADYMNVPAELAKQNSVRLDRLAEKLGKFKGYKIKILGHAVKIHWDNAALGEIEQKSVLLPLSKARTEAIKQALVARGLDAKMIETDGVGAADPLVPDSDYANRWRNRRTAIFLVK
jgi:flagellar motor protein MotB